MSDPVILFVKPGAISVTDKSALSDAGIIVVEIGNPSDVKLVRAGVELPHGDIMAAAGRAINTSDVARSTFGKAMASALELLAGKP